MECKTIKADDINNFFVNFEKLNQARMPIISGETAYIAAIEYEEMENDVPPCGSYWQQAKLLACMTLCSGATAGAGLVLCGWGC